MSRIAPYAQQLRDPRWICLRNSIADARECCDWCGHRKDDEENPVKFHVHHTYYREGRQAWEYPASSLRFLCECCHDLFHVHLNETVQAVGQLSLDQILVVRSFVGKLQGRGDERGRPISELVDEVMAGMGIRVNPNGTVIKRHTRAGFASGSTAGCEERAHA